MADYTPETVSLMLSKINHNCFLPDIQRPFEWKELDIYKLFDSIMREYPIGTFLFWRLNKQKLDNIESNGNLKIAMYRFVDSNTKKNELVTARERDEYLLVLDGQQRLTSFYIAFKGVWVDNNIEQELYFDVLSGKEENADNLLYNFKFLDRNLGLVYVDSEISYQIERDIFQQKILNKITQTPINKQLIEKIYSLQDNIYTRNKRLGKKEEKSIKELFISSGFNLRVWVNIKKIYEDNIGTTEKKNIFAKKIIENKDYLQKYESDIQDRLGDFHSLVLKENVIHYYPEDEDSYDKVLDIFVRTNSGGMKLGYSDLLFSKIKLRWEKARDSFGQLIKNINGDTYNFDNDFILKTCLMIFSGNSEELRYKASNFSDEKINQIKENWLKIVESFEFTIDLLEKFLIKSPKLIPSHNALIPIIYWKYNSTQKALGSDQEANNCSVIRVWLVKTLLSGVFGGQSDFVLYNCKRAIIINDKRNEFPANKIQEYLEGIKGKTMDLKEDALDNISYTDKESYLFLSICYKGAINFEPIYKRNIPEKDHIFSKDELQNAGITDEKLINKIYNIRYVTQYDNRKKSCKTFNEWEEGLEDKTTTFETHFIPSGKWNASMYEEFLKERRKIMLEKLRY